MPSSTAPQDSSPPAPSTGEEAVVTTLPAASAAPAAPKRVLIVDDHTVFRYGLREVVEMQENLVVVGEAGDSTTAMQMFRAELPDLVLMDVTLPGRDGIELTKMIKAEQPQTTILIFSAHSELDYGVRALRAGAMGFAQKESTVEELSEAITTVMQGHYFMSPRLSRIVVDKALRTLDRPPVAQGPDRESADPEQLEREIPLNTLSSKERHVFRLIGDGLSLREIAEREKLSIKTIETHVAHIKAKFQFKHVDEMRTLAIQWHALMQKSESESAPRAEG